MGIPDEIAKLKTLRDDGSISEDEFVAAKGKVLEGTTPPTRGTAASVAAVAKAPSKFLDPKANLRALLGLVALVAILWVGYSFLISSNSGTLADPNRPPTVSEAFGAAIREPRVLVDEDWEVHSGGVEAFPFELSSPRPISIQISGVRDTAKGFSVYLLDSAELSKVRNGGKFSFYKEWSGVRVMTFAKQGKLPSGKLAVAVINTENVLNSMRVHVKIVSDPE